MSGPCCAPLHVCTGIKHSNTGYIIERTAYVTVETPKIGNPLSVLNAGERRRPRLSACVRRIGSWESA